MSGLAIAIVVLIAIIHTYIAVFEMFLWTQRGPKIFSEFPLELFEPTKAMAFNQGAYNAVLAAGLFWSVFIGDDDWQRNVAIFFLIAVAAMGIVGAATVSRRIIFVQTIPAIIGLVAVLL